MIEIPQSAPKGSILRTESAFDLMERVKKVATQWVAPGHTTGSNTHNVSATISLKKDDWDKLMMKVTLTLIMAINGNVKDN